MEGVGRYKKCCYEPGKRVWEYIPDARVGADEPENKWAKQEGHAMRNPSEALTKLDEDAEGGRGSHDQ